MLSYKCAASPLQSKVCMPPLETACLCDWLDNYGGVKVMLWHPDFWDQDIKDHTASVGLFVLGCLLLESTAQAVRKPRLLGEARCRYFSQQPALTDDVSEQTPANSWPQLHGRPDVRRASLRPVSQRWMMKDCCCFMTLSSSSLLCR